MLPLKPFILQEHLVKEGIHRLGLLPNIDGHHGQAQVEHALCLYLDESDLVLSAAAPVGVALSIGVE